MDIHIEFLAQLGTCARQRRRTLSVEAGCTAQDAVRTALADEPEELGAMVLDGDGELRQTILIFVGDDQLDWHAYSILEPDDVIVFAPPIAGG